jgi:ankyrin repeat protein
LHYVASGDRFNSNFTLASKKEITALLIANGADVNAKRVSGSTPLHNAANNVYKEVVELLIDNGADVNAKDMNGMTPLHVAAYGGAREHFELLIAKGADVNAIIKLGHFESRTPLDFCHSPKQHYKHRPPPQTRRQDS